MLQEVYEDNRPAISTKLTRNSFCRKTTMVKHQRRSHQQGGGDLDDADEDDTSDSESADSPSTASHVSHGFHPLDLYTSSHAKIPSLGFQPTSENGQHFPSYAQAVEPRQQPDNFPAQAMNSHLDFTRHPEDGAMRHTEIRQPLYLPEQSNPGISTMNLNANMSQHSYMARTIPERQLTYGGRPVQKYDSPASYSSQSIPTPPPQEIYHTPPLPQKQQLQHQYPSDSERFVPAQYQHHYEPPMQAVMRPMAESVVVGAMEGPPIHPQQMPQQMSHQQWYHQEGVEFQQPIGVIGNNNYAPNHGFYEQKVEGYHNPNEQFARTHSAVY